MTPRFPPPLTTFFACLGLSLGVSCVACAAIAPALDALPGVVSAVEAVEKAAAANRVAVPADVLAEAKALDAAHEASEKARDKKIAAILAAVRRKAAACPPVQTVWLKAGEVAPMVGAAPLAGDAGTEAGK